MGDAAWMVRGKCNKLTWEESDAVFFIGPGKSANNARDFCSTCPVYRACLNYALMYDERGIWAGTTEEERDNMDPWIKHSLREQARKEGTLEVRRVEAGIVVPQVNSLEDSELDALLLAVEQLEVLDLLYAPTSDPTDFAD